MEPICKSHICPNCQHKLCHRSRRSGAVEFILHSLFFVTPYRCEVCDQRFFRLRVFKDAPKAAVEQSGATRTAHGA
jgi:hypothetical protein